MDLKNLGWEYIGYVKPEDEEKFQKLIEKTNCFLEEVLKGYKLGYVRAYVGKAFADTSDFSRGDYLVLVVITVENYANEKKMEIYKNLGFLESESQAALGVPVNIQYTSERQIFNEQSIIDDGYAFKKVS